METITFVSKAYKTIKDQMDAMKTMLRIVCARASMMKWVFEDEASLLLNLKKKSLQRLRQTDVIRSRSISGKKIQYLRTDITAYTDGVGFPFLVRFKSSVIYHDDVLPKLGHVKSRAFGLI